MTADLNAIREKAAQHAEELDSLTWFKPSDLATRWGIAVSTVHKISPDELRYKNFGQGETLKLRRYRSDWVEAYENASGRSPAGESAA